MGAMPKYRIFLAGKHVDVDAGAVRDVSREQNLEFLDDKREVVAAFRQEAILGYVRMDGLIDQHEDRNP